MRINQHSCLLPISDALANIIHDEIVGAEVDTSSGVVINFRDPDYSAETGGFHPVEIAVRSDGHLVYITDFSFAGSPPYAELVKELDFDFELEVFQQYGREYPITQAAELYALWQENFISYHGMGVYQVTVGELS